MSARELRFRILTILGLPAAGLLSVDCKKPPTLGAEDAGAVTRVPTTPSEPSFRPGEPARAEAKRAMAATLGVAPAPLPVCGPDQLPETLCGFVSTPRKGATSPFDNCGSSGDALDESGEFSFGETLQAKLASTKATWTANAKTNADYKLDALRTYNHRVDVAGNLARIEAERPQVYASKYGTLRAENACCFSRCAKLEVSSGVRSKKPDGWVVRSVCIDAPPGGTTLPAAGAPACPVGLNVHTGPAGDVAPAIVPSHIRNATGQAMCCYAVLAPIPQCRDEPSAAECVGPRPENARGRPLRDNGVAVVAGWRTNGDWLSGSQEVPAVRAESLRHALAAAWTTEATMEHASVAAFARLSLELLALGAPADLVDAAHVAARDEIRHAQLAFALASGFAGEPRGPGPLAVPGTWAAPTLVSVAREAFLDGCVGEAVAALDAFVTAEGTTSASIRDVLLEIANDESAHAALAFRVVAWAANAGGPPVWAAIWDLLSEVEQELQAPEPEASPASELEAYGVLSVHRRGEVRRRALREVVVPCARALLDAHGSPEGAFKPARSDVSAASIGKSA